MTIDKYLHMGSKYIIKYIHKRTPQSSRGSLIVQEDSYWALAFRYAIRFSVVLLRSNDLNARLRARRAFLHSSDHQGTGVRRGAVDVLGMHSLAASRTREVNFSAEMSSPPGSARSNSWTLVSNWPQSTLSNFHLRGLSPITGSPR